MKDLFGFDVEQDLFGLPKTKFIPISQTRSDLTAD